MVSRTLRLRHCLLKNTERSRSLQGIVPTLIIVRIGLGISTQDVTSYAASANPSHGGPRAGTAPMPLVLRRQTVNDTKFGSVDDGIADAGARKVDDLIPDHHS